MCTSIVTNFKKPIIGWNLDLLNMQWKVETSNDNVSIYLLDAKEGWLPLFGVNNRGDFVAMPTCYPFDNRSNKIVENQINLLNLDIDILTKKKTINEALELAKKNLICSVDGITFQAQISSKQGDSLIIVPGQGYKYLVKPKFFVLTNFSPFKMDKELHPWMGLDRYNKAMEMLKNSSIDFSINDMFSILKATSQEICPTIVSMVFDASENTLYWCERREWNNIKVKKF